MHYLALITNHKMRLFLHCVLLCQRVHDLVIHHLVGVIAVVGKDGDAAVRESVSVRSSSSAALREQMVTFIDKMQENVADTEAEIVEWYREKAESAGVTLTRDDVMDELAADFAGNMLDDAALFAKFSKENRTAAQKLLDSLKEFLNKVRGLFTGKYRDMAAQEAYGKDFAELEDIAKQWQAAFDAAERQAEKTKTAVGKGDGRMMLKDYSYDALVRKPDMTLAVVEDADGLTRKEVVDKALDEAKKYGGVNQNGNVYVHVNDTDADVVISAKALRHGLDRRFTVNAPATLKVGEILQNAVRVNELVPKLDTVDATYVLMGAAKNKNNEPYIVQFVVNRASNEVMSVDVLYAINAKKEPAALLPEITSVPATLTGSSISIADLLAYVNRYFPDVLPESVLRHFGHSERPAGKLGEGATAVSGAELCERLFQSTPPARGATAGGGAVAGLPLHFNPRPPRGGRRFMRSKRLTPFSFQSTPPARGATQAYNNKVESLSISIHAPREGGDPRSSPAPTTAKIFQSTPPARGRRSVSPHFAGSKVFQSTPPARGATVAGSNVSLGTNDFNPRPPARGATSKK